MQAASGAAGRANVGCSAVHLVLVSGVSSTSLLSLGLQHNAARAAYQQLSSDIRCRRPRSAANPPLRLSMDADGRTPERYIDLAWDTITVEPFILAAL